MLNKTITAASIIIALAALLIGLPYLLYDMWVGDPINWPTNHQYMLTYLSTLIYLLFIGSFFSTGFVKAIGWIITISLFIYGLFSL